MSDEGLHERFRAWLDDGAIGEPARDLAIHAAVCPVCAAWVRAQDALATIDTGLAPLPSSRPEPAAAPGGLRHARRYAAAAGGLVVTGGLVAFGVTQILSGSVTFFPQRAQEVLGATGSPALASVGVPRSTPVSPSLLATATETATPRPLPTPGPALDTPRATPRTTPAAHPTPGSTPTPVPTATPAQTPVATPVRTATPTATPGVTATPSPTPTPTETPSPTPQAS